MRSFIMKVLPWKVCVYVRDDFVLSKKEENEQNKPPPHLSSWAYVWVVHFFFILRSRSHTQLNHLIAIWRS